MQRIATNDFRRSNPLPSIRCSDDDRRDRRLVIDLADCPTEGNDNTTPETSMKSTRFPLTPLAAALACLAGLPAARARTEVRTIRNPAERTRSRDR